MKPCGKCINKICGFDCKCECHENNNPECIRCGNMGMFKVKYRNKPKGLMHFVKTWLCIECRDDFHILSCRRKR